MAKTTYSIALRSYDGVRLIVDVTRTLPDANDPVCWVWVSVVGAPVQALPVIWGMWDSPTGYAEFLVAGHGTASITTTPWKAPGRSAPSVTF